MKAREIRKLNRAKDHRVETRKDAQLEKLVGIALCGSERVLKALSSTDYKMKMRSKFLPDPVSRECSAYRRVRNPEGQQVNARQKQRGKSIPLI